MAATARQGAGRSPDAPDWYRLSPHDVAALSTSFRAVGLSAERAAELLERDGPNALPVEQAVAGWRRFARQYRSYMQMILVGAAIVSLAIQEWSTGSAADRHHGGQCGRRACARRARRRAR